MERIVGFFVAFFCCLHIARAQGTVSPAILPIAQWQWKTADDLLGWTPSYFSGAKVSGGALRGVTQSTPRLVSPPLSIDAAQWTDIEFRLKTTIGGKAMILFSRAGEERSDARRVDFSIVGDNQFHTYRVNLSSHPLWKGEIKQLRFDLPWKAGAQFELHSIRFLPKDTGGLLANGGFECRDANSALPEKWSLRDVRGEGTKAKIVAGRNSPQAVQLQPEKSQEDLLQSAVFEFPTTGPHQLEFDFQSATQALPFNSFVTFFDIFHRPFGTAHLRLKITPAISWRTAQSTFSVPRLAAYGQLTFQTAAVVTLDNVSLLPVPLAPLPWEEGWRANWILPPDAKALPDAPRFFRRAFTIDKADAVTAAKIQVTGDDNARLFINGRELPAGENWQNWQKVDIYDLKPYLRDGENVVGVSTTNRPGSEGVLAELDLQSLAGKITINTDKDWRTFVGEEVEPVWSTPGFDASGWNAARELGIPPILPWNDRPARSNLGLPMPHQIQVTAFHAPAQAQLGQEIAVQLDFVPRSDSDHPTALKLRLVARDPSLSPNSFDFAPLPLDSSAWKKGTPVQLRQTLQLPKYLQSGEYSLSASLTFAAPVEDSVPSARRITLKALPAAPSPTTKVVYLPGDIPAFEINGQITPVMHLMTSGSAASGIRKTIIENSREQNLNLIWLNVEGFDWNPDAPATFAAMDAAIAAALEANPQAYLVLNVPLDPSRNAGMQKWLQLHPDQVIRNDAGSTQISGYDGIVQKGQTYASFASPVWMRDASQSWRELIRHVRSSRFAGRVIGYVPIAGPGAEWWYYGAQKDLIDYSEPFRQAFANWAKAQYGGDLARLNKTWNTDYASFEAIRLPTREQRLKAGHGIFLEPSQSGQAIDLTAFLQEVMADDILQFCRIVKAETQGHAICGTYYGYVMHLGRPYFGAQSGHYALAKVLSSPAIDFLMSPSPYEDRGLGGASGYMTTIDSLKLHGKLYINQSDMRTFRAVGMTSSKVDTLKDSVSILRRQFADSVVNGVAVQWYDFGLGWIAGDKRLMQAVGQMRAIEKTLQHTPRATLDAPNAIAVITSEESIRYTKLDSAIQDAAVDHAQEQLNRTGVAWDSYLLSDLPKLGDYRCFLFLNCFDLSEAQQKFIDEKLKKNGNVLVWVNAPGIIRREAGSTPAQAMYNPQRVSEVTGFDLKPLPDGPLAARLTAGDHPLQQHGITDGTMYGNANISGTRFAAQDGVALGHFNDSEQAALAVKRFDDWTSIYSAAPNLPAPLLRNIARLANVPVINDREGDVTYVSKNLFAVHSLAGGEHVLHVDAKYKVAKELFSNKIYPVQNGQFTAILTVGGTALFLLGD